MSKRILLTVFGWCLLTLMLHAQVSVESSLDSMMIRIGQQTNLYVKVNAPQGTSIQFPNLNQGQYLTPGVEIVETKGPTLEELDNGFVQHTKVYTLTAFDEHLYTIPGIKVRANGKEYASNVLGLKVITVDVDTLHPNKMFPPKGAQDNPFSWQEWLPLFFFSLLLIFLVLLTLYLINRLQNDKPVITPFIKKKKELPHQKALRVIASIKQDKLTASDNSKEYYTKLTDTLRQYIEERFGFNAREMTSREIIQALQQSGNEEMLHELTNIFTTADLVKFAKHTTFINENDLNLVNAVQYIDKTKTDKLPTEEKVEVKPDMTLQTQRKKRWRLIAAIVITGILCVATLAYILFTAMDLLWL